MDTSINSYLICNLVAILGMWSVPSAALFDTEVGAKSPIKLASFQPGLSSVPSHRPYLPDSIRRQVSWLPVPDWLAGTWQAKSQTVFSSYNFQLQRQVIDSPVIIPINRTSTIGVQRDGIGRIWHYVGQPYPRVSETPAFVEYQQIKQVSVLSTSDDEVAIETLAIVGHIDKNSKQVLDEFQEDTITHYTPVKEGLIHVTFTVTDYDMMGRLRSSSKSACDETRIKTFSPVDQDDRGNLREMLNNYLRLYGK